MMYLEAVRVFKKVVEKKLCVKLNETQFTVLLIWALQKTGYGELAKRVLLELLKNKIEERGGFYGGD